MASSLPYLASNKNIDTLFAAILSAKIPDKFTQDFLQSTIGLKGSNDRQVIPLLRTLKFIDQSGSPTSSYRLLKSKETAKQAIADGVRQAYAPLFAANEHTHTLTNDKLKGLVAQVAGTDEDMTARIVSTLSALIKQGDFSTPNEAGVVIKSDSETPRKMVNKSQGLEQSPCALNFTTTFKYICLITHQKKFI
ncbi:hypothetical protein BCF11_3641 [Collimonas sp. PA-H2]|uniref:DUF5343 domain-containing protein n=1 Tax=Collimonas sp. PA-H2 TaxID=1881062 RepID=UPI000BF77238|nr:DUF5343 domain-containing protein [Collimonas sp. PA-H2]PFH11199.1 hypothetical protein BCF11_3641 [Collimonas sp. PA-H2]